MKEKSIYDHPFIIIIYHTCAASTNNISSGCHTYIIRYATLVKKLFNFGPMDLGWKLEV